MIPDRIDLATSSSIHFTIAAPNSLNKERADLDLTDVADPAQAIMDAIAQLDSKRESDDVAIVVEFMGGEIELAEDTNIDLTAYSNLIVRGNGVKIVGDIGGDTIGNAEYVVGLKDSFMEFVSAENTEATDFGGGINVENCVLWYCKGKGIRSRGIYGGTDLNNKFYFCEGESSSQAGIGVSKQLLHNCKGKSNTSFGILAPEGFLENCTGISTSNKGLSSIGGTLIGCTGTSDSDNGISANDGILINCTGNSNSDYGVSADRTSATEEKDALILVGCTFGGDGLLCYDGWGDVDGTLLAKQNRGDITLIQ